MVLWDFYSFYKTFNFYHVDSFLQLSPNLNFSVVLGRLSSFLFFLLDVFSFSIR